ELRSGSVAVVAPDDLCDEISAAMTAAGLDHGRAVTSGLDHARTVVPVSVVKGLELDAVVVVEPSRIVADVDQGMRALYVALTRWPQRLSVVHPDDLPGPLRGAPAATPAGERRDEHVGQGADRQGVEDRAGAERPAEGDAGGEHDDLDQRAYDPD